MLRVGGRISRISARRSSPGSHQSTMEASTDNWRWKIRIPPPKFGAANNNLELTTVFKGNVGGFLQKSLVHAPRSQKNTVYYGQHSFWAWRNSRLAFAYLGALLPNR
ncbi:hypothetical protein KSP40_PGU000453 [Platanthera guangdongensis]|uniref:Uncharacterized protein n=1 Tax=Platanthera guangdongensis TaxID=2320717 RepID=A0ABR2MH10_9ASPA